MHSFLTLRQRFVLITEGTEVTHVTAEQVPSEVTVTVADKILPLI